METASFSFSVMDGRELEIRHRADFPQREKSAPIRTSLFSLSGRYHARSVSVGDSPAQPSLYSGVSTFYIPRIWKCFLL